jgi:hypothetical protein
VRGRRRPRSGPGRPGDGHHEGTGKIVVKAKAPSAGQLQTANLRTGDLPKWRTATAKETSGAADDEALSACAGITTDTSRSVVRQSKETAFAQPGRTGNVIISQVLLMQDEKTVASDVKEIGSKQTRACAAADIAQSFRSTGIDADVWTTEPVQLPAGVKGRAMRLKIRLLTGSGPVPVYVDVALIANRRLESVLYAITTGRNMDPDLHEALVTRLHTRAKAIA